MSAALVSPTAPVENARVSKVSSVLLEEQKDSSIGFNVSLHPLPILTISEHLTRTAIQSGSSEVKVQGALLGTQSGREIEIQNTFEIPLKGGSVDHEFLKARQEQFKQVFPTFEFLGWYSIGHLPQPSDMDIHKQLIEYNESPLFLQLSPGPSSLSRAKAGGELPIAIYETHVEMPDAQSSGTSGPAMFFRPASYHVETGEAERIAVDHTSKPPDAVGDAQSSLIASLTTQYNAIKMLSDRIKTVVDYVHAVKSQKIPKDDEICRQISSLVSGLPASGELEEFRQEFLTEYNDLLLTSYLANMTSGLNALNELVDVFDVSQTGNEEGGAGPRSRGGNRARPRALNI
ncbi:hypothetical protein CBS101457_004745 [Exobasidium rhododendri]|nr:hypothetical protein CBS101457_004745 [Exobasidium rhododendri]